MNDFEMIWDSDEMDAALAEVIRESVDYTRELCNVTVELAKENSPYQHGTNRKSITADFSDGQRVETVGDSPSAGGDEGMPTGKDIGFRVYTQSGYGAWLEIGTARMGARPYIMPGFETAQQQLEQRLNGMF